MRDYAKFEFCKDVKCGSFISGSKEHKIDECCMWPHDGDCEKTAKEFQNWLKENNFTITKGDQ